MSNIFRTFYNTTAIRRKYTGVNNQGESQFENDDSFRGKMEPTTSLVTDENGNNIVAESRLITDYNDLDPKDELSIDGERYDILKISSVYFMAEENHNEILLRRHV